MQKVAESTTYLSGKHGNKKRGVVWGKLGKIAEVMENCLLHILL